MIYGRIFLLVLIRWMVTGCATPTPPSKEYLLMDSGLKNTQPQATKTMSVQLMPIVVANYLAGSEIVLVTKQGDVHRSQNNLWAEPLSPQLARLTLQRLEKTLPNSDNNSQTEQVNTEAVSMSKDKQTSAQPSQQKGIDTEVVNALEKLVNLKQQGFLTDEEFTKAKENLLRGLFDE